MVPVFAAINRLRGGGFFADKLPGHPRLYAAVLAAFASALFIGPLDAVVVAACFLAWSWLPWGSWYGLGRFPHPDETRFEAFVTKVSFGSDHVAFTVRNLIGLVPAAALISPLFLLLAPAQTLAYEIGWRTSRAAPTITGEWLTGALWGLFVWWLA